MRSLLLFCSILMSFSALAEVSVMVQCHLLEQSGGHQKNIKTDIVTLSSMGRQTLAIHPLLGMDNSAIFILALAKGNSYLDVEDEEVGADYILSLSRVQNAVKEPQLPLIKGKTQDITILTLKEGKLESAAYRDSRFKKVNRMPKVLRLSYQLKGKKDISVKCELFN